MSSIECILTDLHISLSLISAVSSPGNVPNKAISSTRFLVTVPFFFFLTMSSFFRTVFQIWFTLAGCDKLALGFEPIRIKEKYFEK